MSDAVRVHEPTGDPIPLVQCTAAAMPFPDRTFDAVHASWLLEHVAGQDVVPILREARHGIARRVHNVGRHGISPDGVYGLDLGQLGHLGGGLVGILDVFELDGGTLEQLEAQVLAQRRVSFQVIDERV